MVETGGNHGPKEGPSLLPCIQTSMSDMQVLDLKAPPTRQPDLSEKDDYTVRYAGKRENANNLLLVYPTIDIHGGGGGGEGKTGGRKSFCLSPVLIS